jgi:hypothetical protein
MPAKARPPQELDLKQLSPGVLRWAASTETLMWCGALSFEPRCASSLELLGTQDCLPRRVVVLTYPTDVRPLTDDRQRREAHFSRIVHRADRTGQTLQQIQIVPYSFHSLREAIQPLFSDPNQRIVFDISCLTKVHTMALAAQLAASDLDHRWLVSYSMPENYGDLEASHRVRGWKDVLIAPLLERGTIVNERFSRGIVLAGHEADRLVVAMAELESAGGTVVLSETPGRPDLRQITEGRNAKTLRQLAARSRSGIWTTAVVALPDVNEVSRIVGREIEQARKNNAPLVLYPFGPKLTVFAAAMRMCREYGERSWFVCPIPWSYDVDHSQGWGGTLWHFHNPLERSVRDAR